MKNTLLHAWLIQNQPENLIKLSRIYLQAGNKQRKFRAILQMFTLTDLTSLWKAWGGQRKIDEHCALTVEEILVS